jgi:hypothetical protein
MMVATTACLSYDYRSDPVKVPFCRWHGFALFCAHREREIRCYWNTINPAMNMSSSVTSGFSSLHQKVKTQIPIARRPSLTAELHPAVSSLEAYKTPAR